MIKKKKTSRPEGVLRFKKISGGIHNHRDGQVVRKGEILYAKPEELSEIVRPGFKCLDTEVKEGFSGGMDIMVKARGNGWFDIINRATGEKINDQAMRAKDAREFLSGDNKDEQMKDIEKEAVKKEEEELEEEIEKEVEEDSEETTGKL